MLIVDFDDFAENNNRLDLLFKLKELNAKFKATLFTVPSQTSVKFLQNLNNKMLDTSGEKWLEYAVHGYNHTYLECKYWFFSDSHYFLALAEESGLYAKGFKAPYWEMSKDLYDVLLDRGYWIADHDRNDGMRPLSLPCYKVDNRNSIHGHIQNVCGNGIEETFEYLLGRIKNETEFKFISEVIK